MVFHSLFAVLLFNVFASLELRFLKRYDLSRWIAIAHKIESRVETQKKMIVELKNRLQGRQEQNQKKTESQNLFFPIAVTLSSLVPVVYYVSS